MFTIAIFKSKLSSRLLFWSLFRKQRTRPKTVYLLVYMWGKETGVKYMKFNLLALKWIYRKKIFSFIPAIFGTKKQNEQKTFNMFQKNFRKERFLEFLIEGCKNDLMMLLIITRKGVIKVDFISFANTDFQPKPLKNFVLSPLRTIFHYLNLEIFS